MINITPNETTYFSFEENAFCINRKTKDKTIVEGGVERPIYTGSSMLLDAILGGKNITEEEYNAFIKK